MQIRKTDKTSQNRGKTSEYKPRLLRGGTGQRFRRLEKGKEGGGFGDVKKTFKKDETKKKWYTDVHPAGATNKKGRLIGGRRVS